MKRILMILMTLCLVLGNAIAGNLEPSGPPAGTMKPLDQVEPRIAITSLPYTISASGSYYLIKNLTAANSGITLTADDVTIDLCGFTIAGSGATNSIGILINGKRNVEVCNGSITNFSEAINDSVTSKGGIRIINVRVVANKSGISLSNNYSLVKECTVTGNGISATSSTAGISVGGNSCVIGNVVGENGTSATGQVYGIFIFGGTASNNCVYNNGNSATNYVYALSAGPGSTVSANTVCGNGSSSSTNSYGINTNANCTITNNTVRYNNGSGIVSGTSCHIIDNCAASNTNYGISTGDNSTVSQNTVTSNSSNGINAGDHVNITGNTVTSNGTWGIYCTGGCVARNTVSLNNTTSTAGKGGIYVSAHSQVHENTLEGNTKNNIYIAGSRSSVEGNVMSGSDYGINFGSNGNIYMNNRATANGTNYNAAGSTDGGGNVSF